jgi:hypothetical protein
VADAETPRTLTEARAPEAPIMAPPGERVGFTGWLRGLGFQTNTPPSRLWQRLNTVVTGDERDLTSYHVGPRALFGANFLPAVGDNSAFQVVAGAHGCRVMVDLQVEVAVTTISFVIAPPITLNAPSAPATSAPLTMYLNDADQPLFGTRAFVGGISAATLAAVLPGNDSGAYFVRTAGVAANSQFHIGGGQVFKPHLFLAPGRALIVAHRATNNFTYLSGYVEEPGSAKR